MKDMSNKMQKAMTKIMTDPRKRLLKDKKVVLVSLIELFAGSTDSSQTRFSTQTWFLRTSKIAFFRKFRSCLQVYTKRWSQRFV
jgi:hypothetical protein